MATYIIADLKLFNKEQLKKLGYANFLQMNAEIIRSWNKVVKPEDDVIIMGDNGDGMTAVTPNCIRTLCKSGKIRCVFTGKKLLVDLDDLFKYFSGSQS